MTRDAILDTKRENVYKGAGQNQKMSLEELVKLIEEWWAAFKHGSREILL